MTVCRLCLQERELRRSHIVPEFLYADLYNEKGHMMGINGRGRKGWRPLQQGITERLFCDACEQHFNESCEKPFKRQWIDQPKLPNRWPEVGAITVQVDYKSFKLFHLSVLFRASVSTLPTFTEVQLGPHEDQIRSLLLSCQPGPAWKYPILGIALFAPKTREPMQIITMPIQTRFSDVRAYSVAYGGVNWWIAIASHPSHELTRAALGEDGRLDLVGMPWTELGLMRQASRMLRGADA